MGFLDESRELYERYGAPMIEARFPDYAARIAAGLAGHGSECFGFDDDISRDHDLEPGFCLWIDEATDREIGVELSRAYRALPLERGGQRSALAEKSRGVRVILEFYRRYTGSPGAPESWQQWLHLPSYALAEAVNGEVWRDDAGVFSAIRREIAEGMPEDVRIKKLAACAVSMAQSGQYNYSRCIKRGEDGAAMLALGEFVKSTAYMIHLLNRRHMPYYKWMLRSIGTLPRLGELRGALEFLLTAENDDAGKKTKAGVVEDICAALVRELRADGLTCGSWGYMECHGLDMQGHIQNSAIRAEHILEGI